jgi:hypothetical protein
VLVETAGITKKHHHCLRQLGKVDEAVKMESEAEKLKARKK